MAAACTFKIVIGYDRYESGARALEMSRRLSAHLFPAIHVQSEAWKFEHVKDLHLDGLVEESVVAANMLVIAVEDGRELPPYIMRWIEKWSSHSRSGPAALVAMHNTSSDSSEVSPLHDYLARVARESRTDFFWAGENFQSRSFVHSVSA